MNLVLEVQIFTKTSGDFQCVKFHRVIFHQSRFGVGGGGSDKVHFEITDIVIVDFLKQKWIGVVATTT